MGRLLDRSNPCAVLGRLALRDSSPTRSSLLLALFAVVLVRIWRIAHLSKDLLGTYLCAGVFTMLLWQVFQNIGMTLKIMPVTGLPMPFISYGGSGLITWFALLGLVQNVHMRRMA